MKKLLLLLLLPFLGLAQMSGPTSDDVADGEGAAGLVFLGTTANANESLGNVQVNDTIILGIKLTNWLAGSAEVTGNEITYAHIDVQYNKNAYTWIDETYHASTSNSNWSGAAGQNSTYIANGMKWSIASTSEAYDLWGQWQDGAAGSDSDWNLAHLQTQVTSGDLSDLDAYVTFRLKVHDAGANHDYTDNVFIPNGKLVDNPNSKTYDPVYAYENQDLSLTPGADIDVTAIKAKLVTGDNVDVTKFKLVPLIKNTTEDNDGDGVIDDFYYTIIQGQTFWLDVPSNGIVDITEYITDNTGDYAVVWEYGAPGATDRGFKTLYEDVLTISDVQLALKELAQHGNDGGINAAVSILNADVAGGTNGNDGQLTDADTYALLAHVTGIEELYIDYDNDGDIDDVDINAQGGYFFRTLDGSTYTDTAASTSYQNNITHGGGFVTLDIDFSNTTTDQVFTKYGTWKGDVNLSHSPDVSESVQNDAMSIANSSALRMTRVQSYGEAKMVVETIEGTLNVVEQGEDVIATITIPEGSLTAAQIKLTYDDTRLSFESVETSSGNTTTNFAKHSENRVNFGSINMLDATLPQVTYKVKFNKLAELNGVTGLVILTNTDAADNNADRVELKIN